MILNPWIFIAGLAIIRLFEKGGNNLTMSHADFCITPRMFSTDFFVDSWMKRYVDRNSGCLIVYTQWLSTQDAGGLDRFGLLIIRGSIVWDFFYTEIFKRAWIAWFYNFLLDLHEQSWKHMNLFRNVFHTLYLAEGHPANICFEVNSWFLSTDP